MVTVNCQGTVPKAPKKSKGKPTDAQRKAMRKYKKKLGKNPSMKRLRASVKVVAGSIAKSKKGKGKKGKKGGKGRKK